MLVACQLAESSSQSRKQVAPVLCDILSDPGFKHPAPSSSHGPLGLHRYYLRRTSKRVSLSRQVLQRRQGDPGRNPDLLRGDGRRVGGGCPKVPEHEARIGSLKGYGTPNSCRIMARGLPRDPKRAAALLTLPKKQPWKSRQIPCEATIL